MENNPISSDVSKFENFFEYIFNFDDENKAKLMNIVQYLGLALIPVVILLKLIKNYFPEEDDTKGSVEISVEVLSQIILIFIGIWFIDRLIRYLPTISKMNYHGFNEINFIIPVLIILVTMQTKLGAKINILSNMRQLNAQPDLSFMDNEPMAANGVLGGGFGTMF
jgi:uncharacterized membrane protein YidH (DUF202 family)